MFPLRVGKKKRPYEEAERTAREFMELTQITELADKKPDAMSGGQQQRVAITRALVQRPKILLLDEPLSNLDARLRLQIREEIRRLVKRIGITTIFVTHDQEEAMSISDRIVLMNDGIVQQFDTAQKLYMDPVNVFVASFIGNPAMNLLPVRLEAGQLRVGAAVFTLPKLWSELADGDYTLGIRPEYVNPDEQGAMRVRIDLVERIGKECILHFQYDEQDMRAVVPIHQEVAEGTSVNMTLDPRGWLLFDQEGKRVA